MFEDAGSIVGPAMSAPHVHTALSAASQERGGGVGQAMVSAHAEGTPGILQGRSSTALWGAVSGQWLTARRLLHSTEQRCSAPHSRRGRLSERRSARRLGWTKRRGATIDAALRNAHSLRLVIRPNCKTKVLVPKVVLTCTGCGAAYATNESLLQKVDMPEVSDAAPSPLMQPHIIKPHLYLDQISSSFIHGVVELSRAPVLVCERSHGCFCVRRGGEMGRGVGSKGKKDPNAAPDWLRPQDEGNAGTQRVVEDAPKRRKGGDDDEIDVPKGKKGIQVPAVGERHPAPPAVNSLDKSIRDSYTHGWRCAAVEAPRIPVSHDLAGPLAGDHPTD